MLHGDPRLSPVVTAASGFPSRHRKNNEKAQEASVLLKDNLELQNFLQNCQEVRPSEASCFAGEPFLGAKSPEVHRDPLSLRVGFLGGTRYLTV